MFKAFLIRLVGLVISLAASVPALTAFLKGIEWSFSAVSRAPQSWYLRWAWTWMPAIRYPIRGREDFLSSIPGLLAACVVGIGLAVAFGKRRKQPLRRWEEQP